MQALCAYIRGMLRWIAPAFALVVSAPLLAHGVDRESLGVFGDWGAFRDSDVPRCYAIAEAEGRGGAFATISTWPRQNVRQQVHFRLSRSLASDPRMQLAISGQRFALSGSGTNGWAENAAADARVVAAMRSASSLSVSATDTRGRRFTDRYSLDGAATAIDAAAVGCANR